MKISRSGSLSQTMCQRILCPGLHSSHIHSDIYISLSGGGRIQPLSGKVTSVSQMEEDTSRSEDMEKGTTGAEDGEGEVEGRGEYSGGRFAGVGEFEPTPPLTSKKRKVTLPLFRCKPEAALR